MSNIKTLALAAFTVMSLGGVAMAQEGAPSMPTIDYWATKTIATRQAAGNQIQSSQIQSGSSDVSAMPGDVPMHFDYSVLANPG
jgi:hypothetical protein